MAPPSWWIMMSQVGVGRLAAASTITSMAASGRPAMLWADQWLRMPGP